MAQNRPYNTLYRLHFIESSELGELPKEHRITLA